MSTSDEGERSSISIDQEEFTRLQTQLIDLRTKNYQLQEDQSKKDAEYQQLLSSMQATTKELEKANKTIQRSKKAKEYQLLGEENESLQQRLHTQEEDFKLQNKTLMDELAKVFEEKEMLLRSSKDKTGKDSPEMTRLQAENKALQKSLHTLQEQLKSDGTSTAESTVAAGNVDVQLATLEEEKKLLQKQLDEVEDKGRRESMSLQSQLDKLDEKARKKQETLMQLQNEKEKILNESKLSYDAMCEEKDKVIQSLKDEIKQLKELEEKMQQDSKSTAELIQQVNSLKREKEEISIKCQHMSEHEDVITKEHKKTKLLLEEIGNELQQAKQELTEEKRKRQQLEKEVKDSQQANDELADQLLNYREEKLKLEENVSNIEKLAEKRKSLLDEMAIKEHEKATEKKRKEDELTETFQKQIESLKVELQEERSKAEELSHSLEELTDLRRRIKSMENMKEIYEEQLQNTKETADSEIAELKAKLDDLQRVHEEESVEMKENLEEEQNKVKELSEKVSQLETEVDEKSQEIQIAGKKSANLIKDLKKQLQQLQKKEEKLQELQLSTSGLEISSISSPIRQDSRHSRESSLSSVKGPELALPQQLDITDGENKQDIQTLLDKIATLQQEKWQLEEKVNHLESTGASLAEDVIQKSAIIQNHFMENKADHSSTTSHSQQPQHSKMSPMRFVQWAKAPGKEDTMAEINRKMQRALEEALMKNIHLQQNVDMLSSELQSKNSEQNSAAATSTS